MFLLLRRSDSECLSRIGLQSEISNSGGLTCASSAPHGGASPIPLPRVGRATPNLRVTPTKTKTHCELNSGRGHCAGGKLGTQHCGACAGGWLGSGQSAGGKLGTFATSFNAFSVLGQRGSERGATWLRSRSRAPSSSWPSPLSPWRRTGDFAQLTTQTANQNHIYKRSYSEGKNVQK